MKKTIYSSQTDTPSGVVLVDIKRLQGILSCGMQTATKIAADADAGIKIGRRKLYNVEKIKKYLNQLGG